MLSIKSQNTINIDKNTDVATQMKKTRITDENEVRPTKLLLEITRHFAEHDMC